MNAEIEIKSNNGFVIPEKAVVAFERKQFVFVEKNKTTFELLEGKTGNTENGLLEIVSNEVNLVSKNIVTKGAYNLLMTMKNTEE